jgi:hypothetical protein
MEDLFNLIDFTYDSTNNEIKSNLTGQILPITESFKNYLKNLSVDDINKLRNHTQNNAKLSNLIEKNKNLFDIIKKIQEQCKSKNQPECSESFVILLNQLHVLEIKIIVYICKQLKDTKNSELLQKFFESVTPKLTSLNEFYDQKLSQNQLGGFHISINSLYKEIKYKGKYLSLNKKL